MHPQQRWNSHRSRATLREDEGRSPIHDAMRIVGLDNFTFEIIGWYEDYNYMEQYYIEKYNTLVPNGYNLLPGGEEPPIRCGKDHHNSVYEQDLIDKIIDDLISHNYTQKEIEIKYNVPQNLVTSINRGITHRREGIEYPIIKVSKYHLKPEEIEDIKYLLEYGTCTLSEIAQYFGVNRSSIDLINSGRHHKDIDRKYPIRTRRGIANSQSVETILANRSTPTIDTQVEM